MIPIKETINQFKWVLLAGVIVAILIALITANFHVLQFMKYKMSNDTEGIIKTLESSVSSRSQKEWYFKQGLAYLLEQDEYTDEMKQFFEAHFEGFSDENRKEIIKGYNAKALSLPMSEGFMDFLVSNRQEEDVKVYIKNMKPDELDTGLALAFGKKPEVDENFVNTLNDMLIIYPEKLPFDKFQFSLYQVLVLAGEKVNEKTMTIFNKIEPQSARNNLFGELKTKEISEKQLGSLVNLLKETGIITLSEIKDYEAFYSELCMARSKYQGMDEEIIALQNKKDSVEAQISESSDKLKIKRTEVSKMQSEVNEVEGKIDKLTTYTYLTLYVEGSSGTGSNEYIASPPRGGLFGVLRPSDQKYIVKLTDSSFTQPGVYNVNVYLQGSKSTSNGGQYPYYVELSSGDISQMESLAADRDNKVAALNKLKQEAEALEANIAAVKQQNNYDEIVEALNSVDSRRNEYVNKVNEKIAAIKELFGFSKLKISIDDKQ